MKLRFLLTVGLAFLGSFALALDMPDARWIGFKSSSSEKPEVKALSLSEDQATISVDIRGLEAGLVPQAWMGTDKETFVQLSIPGYAFTGDIGKPKLPMVTAVLDAPHGAKVEVEVLSANYQEIPLSQWGIYSRIAPALESVEKVPGAKANFVIDETTYHTDAFYPHRSADIFDNSIEGGLARGHRLVTLRLYPVQYNPVKGTVRYATEIKAKVRFIGGDWQKTRAMVEKDYSQPWEDFIKRMVLNYQAAGYKAPPALPVYYDIFYGQNFSAAAQALAEWKTKKGFKVRMNMAGGWTAAQVNDSIRLRTPVATYVTILSDPNATGTDRIPASATGSSSGDQTDLYYAETNESGYLPDLYYARISVKTAAEANIVVDKLLRYEHANFGSAGTAWLRKACLIAGYDAGYQPVGIATNEYCRQILAREGYTTIDTLIIGSSEQEARIVNRINGGRAWTIYTAHGSQTYWAISSSGDFTIPELQTTTNQDMYTFAAGHCCLANDFEYSSDCFGETWPKLANKAGVSYYGSVPSTYWDEDDWLQRRYFDAIYDSVPGQPNLKMSEPGRFTQYGLYWIENHTSTSRKRYYFEAYHVMNDPAMDFWTGEPDQFLVTHAAQVAPNSGTFQVNVKDNDGSTNLENALVCCWVKDRSGEHWSAYTDASGNANLPVMASTPGDTMWVTVTRHNYQPYEGYALVVVPANVSIVPDHIPVLQTTPVTVTVTEPDPPYNGVPNVMVTISGLGVSPALVETTDASGMANFNVYPLYGELLSVVGRKIGEAYDMFQDTIWVTGGQDYNAADISVSVPDIGLNGMLSPDYEGVFDASCDPAGFRFLATGCGVDIDQSTSGGSLQVTGTPTAEGTVTAHIVKEGYNVYTESFPCRIVYGTLTGTVTEQGSSAPVVGAKLAGWVSGADTTLVPASFRVVTNSSGQYTVPDSLEVGRYDIYASKFGYIDAMVVPFVVYGPNVFDFQMEAAPSGEVTGVVLESGTNKPLTATVEIYRSDNGSLYTTVYSDSLNGGQYSTGALPYFNYRFEVKAYRHRKALRTVTVNSPAQTEDFSLEPTQGDILVVNDDDGVKSDEAKSGSYEVGKLGAEELTKLRNPKGEQSSKAGESAAQMVNMLTELGYSVTLEQSSATDPASWSGYDVLVWSCGADNNPVSVAAYRTNLINYVNGGGKLLLEGGEIAWDWDTEDPTFASTVMHANDWDGDDVGALILQQADHPLATSPNVLPTSLAVAYGSNYGNQDASKPTNGGVVVYGTTSYPADGGIIAYDNDGDPTNGQIVYYLFNFLVLADSATRAQLLENSVEYLLRPSAPPASTLSGVVQLAGQSNHEGIVVSATMGSQTFYDTTDALGNYSFVVYDGVYRVSGAKAGYVDTASNRQVTVSGSGSANFVLYPVVVSYQSDFEANNGGLTGTNDWQYGVPTSGPGAAHSGTKLWATNLAGNYSNSSNSTLTLPEIANLSANSKFEFWHWHYFEGTTTLWDGGNVKISTNGGGSWTVITPEGGYTGTAYASTPGVGGQPIFGGQSGGWVKKVFDLSAYAGQNVMLRLHFGSDGSVTYAGWYVDDMMVYAIDFTGVCGEPQVESRPTVFSLGAAYPNPVRQTTSIRFGLPKETKVELGVYNIVGQRVATLASGLLPAGYHTVRWDGRDDGGRKVSGGVYFYRLKAGDFTSTKRLTILR